MKAADWIDRLKAKREWESDYRAAKELGIARATVSKYRSGKTPTFDEETTVIVAKNLGVPVEVLLLDQAVERTKSDEAREALQRALKRLGGAVAGVVLAAGLASPLPSPAGTVPLLADGSLLIMSNRRRDDEDDEPDDIEPMEPLPDWLVGLWLFTRKSSPAFRAN